MTALRDFVTDFVDHAADDPAMPRGAPTRAVTARPGARGRQETSAVKTRRRTGPTDVVKATVFDQDGGACVRCGTRGALTVHHCGNRGMGGAREPGINAGA
ncbi:hypothetical protein ACH47Z_43600 [Streptomyces sp. NPDC020192]|uniref:hypothetical protein n=1 Tax=Streptomyces sp. NPDC020192 TaxID=3365066 RepID=UPI0037BC9DF8